MYKQKRETKLFITTLFLVILIVVLLSIGNYKYIKANPGGNDFLVHWKAFRLFFQKGFSPYSDETALETQKIIYGGPAQAGQHQMRMLYPLYSILLFGPFAAISNFDIARTIWMTFSELAIIGLALISLKICEWKPKRWLLIIFLIFTLVWYHSLRPLINGNAVVFVALGIVGILYAIRENLDELAGVFLALCTIKPQVVFGFAVFILFWSIIQKRTKLILWFFITLILLCGAAALLIPDWMIQNFREVLRYSSYTTLDTPAAALNAIMGTPGLRIGTTLSVLMIALVIIETWITRKANYRGFLWMASLTLVASQWFGISTDPGNFIVCFPAIVIIFSLWQERWNKTGTWLILGATILLLGGIWAIFFATVEHTYQPVQSPIMFFPLPLILLIGLYWVRWWAMKPPEVWFDKTSGLEKP
jgi:hypothetical protein